MSQHPEDKIPEGDISIEGNIEGYIVNIGGQIILNQSAAATPQIVDKKATRTIFISYARADDYQDPTYRDPTKSFTRHSQGNLHLALDQYNEARSCYETALTICDEIDDKVGGAACVRQLGETHLKTAEYTQAQSKYHESPASYRKIGNRLGEAHCLLGLGDALFYLGEHSLAKPYFVEAISICREIGNIAGQSRGLVGQARLEASGSNVQQMDTYYHQALELLVQSGLKDHPSTQNIRREHEKYLNVGTIS